MLNKRVLGLDILRTIAILLVVYLHAGYLLPESFHKAYWSLNIIDGVSIFFVLSGFLIGGILLKIIDTKHFDRKELVHFWKRRWMRTIPNYLLVLLFLIAYSVLTHTYNGRHLLSYFFFCQNFNTPISDFFPESWSLCIEEWFYLLFPFFLFVLIDFSRLDKKRAIRALLLLFILVPLLIRIYRFSQLGEVNDMFYRSVVIMRLDSILYGLLGAYVKYYHEAFWTKYKKGFFALSILLLACFVAFDHIGLPPSISAPYKATVMFSIESLITLFSLPLLSQLRSIKSTRLAAFFTFISVISYSMYILNLSVIQRILLPVLSSKKLLILYALRDTQYYWILNYSLFWIFTISISYLLYKKFEKPIMDLRK